MMIRRKKAKARTREEVHDKLYALADKLLKRHNPCANCWAKNCYREHSTQRCCEGCIYFKEGVGCTTQALYCKLWLCAKPRQPELRKKLRRLWSIADKYGLLVARASREETLEFGEQLHSVQWWLYYRVRWDDTEETRDQAHHQLRHGPYQEVRRHA